MVSASRALSPSLRLFRYELERAQELLESGECGEAREAFEQLRQRTEAEGIQSAQLCHGLGVAAAACGDLAAGVQHLLSAICMDPLNADFRGSLEHVLLRVRLALLDGRCEDAGALYALLEQAQAADLQARAALARHQLRASLS